MSPKVPLFEPQAKTPMEGPSTFVDANTYGMEGRQQAEILGQQGQQLGVNWASVGETGEKLTSMGLHFAKVGEHLQYARDVVDVQNAIGKRDLQLGELRLKNRTDPEFINVTDEKGNKRPRTWQETQAFATEQATNVVKTLRANLTPTAQALFDAHSAKPLADTVLHMTGEAQKREIGNIVKDGQGAIDDKIQLIATGQADISELTKIMSILESTGLFTPQQIKRLEKESYNKVDITRGQLMAENNPDDFLSKIKDREFLKNITEQQRNVLVSHAKSIKTNNQAMLWDEVQKGFANGRLPTQAQINSLSGAHQLSVKHLLKSMANEDSKPVLLELGNRVIQLKSDDAPATIKEGTKLYNDILVNPNLSSRSKLSFMNTVQTKINGAQLNASKFQDDYIIQTQKMMSPAQAGLFGIDYVTKPDGVKSLPPNATTADIAKHINTFAIPYLSASRDYFKVQSKRNAGKARTMEADLALFGPKGKPAGKSPGFRPGRYQLPNGKVVSIRTQADWDKYQGK